MEDYADKKTTTLFESVDPTSKTNENFETKNLKDVESESGSDTRKRTKPESDALEKKSKFSRVLKDNFDWFDGIEDEDIILDDLQEDFLSCNNEPGPSAKRYRR